MDMMQSSDMSMAPGAEKRALNERPKTAPSTPQRGAAAAAASESYAWQVGSERQRWQMMESRREELKEEMQNSLTKPEELRSMLVEWGELVKARDLEFHHSFEKANKRLKDESMVELFGLLQEFYKSKISFAPEEARLKSQIAALHKTLEAYCGSIEPEEPVAAPAPPPPPPPPPPPCTPCVSVAPARVRLPKAAGSFSPASPNRKAKRYSSGGKSSAVSPLRTVNRGDMLSQICSADRRKALRRTAMPRSPGGTPARAKRRYSISDSRDLITVALQAKFKNVRPMAGSPAVDSPKSSSNWALSPVQEHD